MKVLITGGSTWAKIDEVRIITNIFTGKTSLSLAKEFTKRGCRVTLLLNPHCIEKLPSNIKIISFRYFDELKKSLKDELSKNKYDLIIHAAAVSDYKLKKPFKGKVLSGAKQLTLRLLPSPKLTKLIRHLAAGACLIQFKLEIRHKGLISKAVNSLKQSKFDLVVANALEDLTGTYKAFLIDRQGNTQQISSRKLLTPWLLEFANRLR